MGEESQQNKDLMTSIREEESSRQRNRRSNSPRESARELCRLFHGHDTFSNVYPNIGKVDRECYH